MEITSKKSGIRSYLSGMLLLFVLAHFFHHLIPGLLNPLLPYIREEFSLSNTQIGWLTSAFTLTYGFSQLPIGWLADRIGSRWVVTMGVFGVAVMGFLTGLSPTFPILVICMILMGIIGGGYHSAAAPQISDSTAPENRGAALGIHQAGGSASPFIVPVAAAAVAVAFGGWRSSFIVISIPGIVFGVIAFLLMGKSKRMTRPQAKEEKSAMAPANADSLTKVGAFIVLSVIGQAIIQTVTTFIPVFMVSRFKTSKETAAVWLTIARSGGMLAGPLGGLLSDRIGKLNIMVVASLLVSPAIYLINLMPYGVPLGAVLILIVMVQYVRMVISESYIISQIAESKRSTALGVYYFASRGAPGLTAPLLGFLFDHLSFGSALGLTGLTMFVTTLALSPVLLKRKRVAG
ncbi:MAG: MFS transporter [Chloroflexota bacterium]